MSHFQVGGGPLTVKGKEGSFPVSYVRSGRSTPIISI